MCWPEQSLVRLSVRRSSILTRTTGRSHYSPSSVPPSMVLKFPCRGEGEPGEKNRDGKTPSPEPPTPNVERPITEWIANWKGQTAIKEEECRSASTGRRGRGRWLWRRLRAERLQRVRRRSPLQCSGRPWLE